MGLVLRRVDPELPARVAEHVGLPLLEARRLVRSLEKVREVGLLLRDRPKPVDFGRIAGERLAHPRRRHRDRIERLGLLAVRHRHMHLRNRIQDDGGDVGEARLENAVLKHLERPHRLGGDGLVPLVLLEPAEERTGEAGGRRQRDLGAVLVGVAVKRDARDGPVDDLARELDRMVDLLLLKPSRGARDAERTTRRTLIVVRHHVVGVGHRQSTERDHLTRCGQAANLDVTDDRRVRHPDVALLPAGRIEVRVDAFRPENGSAGLRNRRVARQLVIERSVVLRDELGARDSERRLDSVLVDALRLLIGLEDAC